MFFWKKGPKLLAIFVNHSHLPNLFKLDKFPSMKEFQEIRDEIISHAQQNFHLQILENEVRVNNF